MKWVINEADSGRWENEMECGGWGAASRAYSGHSRKQAWNGFVKPDPSQLRRTLSGAGFLIQGQGTSVLIVATCEILVKLLTSPPGMCRGPNTDADGRSSTLKR